MRQFDDGGAIERPRQPSAKTFKMSPVDHAGAAERDYRASHLAKGSRYDAYLSESPFDAYMSAWERRHLPAVVKRFFPSGIDRYLDFACGTGRITEQIAPMARQSTAVDISQTMADEARKKCPQTRFFVGDLTQQNPDLGQFDLVSSFRFFGNAQDELRRSALQAIVQRIAPGGHLLINSHRNPRALYAVFERLTGGTALTMDLHLPKLRDLLANHGLRIVFMQPIAAWMYRSGIMLSTKADAPTALKNEARFSRSLWAAIAPDTIVVAQKL